MKDGENFVNYIVESKLLKKSNVLVTIPVFNSYEITKKTLSMIYDQKNIKFDILIVDNASEDYKKLLIDFPNINYVVLKENTGNSGGQKVAAAIAVKHNYEYIIFNDNDAIPIDQDMFQSQIEYLETNDNCGAVLPFREGRQKGRVDNAEFHFFMIKSETVKKIGLPNSDYFMSFDDIDYSTRIYQAGLYIFRINKKYYHPYTKCSSLFNPSIYFRTRSLLIFIFNKNIFLRYKYKYILYFFQYIGFHIFHSITLQDISIGKTIMRAVVDFIKSNLTLRHPVNKFVFKPIDEDINLLNFNLEKNRLFLYYGKKFVNAEGNFNSYFQIIRKGN